MKCFCCLEKPRKFAEFKKYLTHYLCSFRIYQIYFNKNKNTLSGPANRKKTTRHHAHLSLCAKSRKTNDAKSRKWPKTSIWAIFDDVEVKYLQVANFSEK